MNQWKVDNPEPEKALSPVERARMAEMKDAICNLRMEIEILKKSRDFLRQDTTVEMSAEC